MTELKLSLSNHNSFLSSSKPETCMKSVGFLGLEYILASLCLDHLSFCIPSLYITYFSFKWLLQCEIFSLPSNQNSEFPVAKSNGLCWSWGLVSCPTHGCSSSQGLENSVQAPEDLTLFFFSWAWVCVCAYTGALCHMRRGWRAGTAAWGREGTGRPSSSVNTWGRGIKRVEAACS